MFKHETSKKCWYGIKCTNKLCQFQHTREEINDDIPTISESLNVDEDLKCGKCEFVAKTETDLVEHLDDIHEEWKVTEYFCNHFCRPEHDIHICWSPTDFKGFLGFDIQNTEVADNGEDSIFKCLECEFSSESQNDMREHISSYHKSILLIKCSFCETKNSSWKQLKGHFESKHMEPYVD